MGVKEKAIALHGEGCNCAQSVLCSLECLDNIFQVNQYLYFLMEFMILIT